MSRKTKQRSKPARAAKAPEDVRRALANVQDAIHKASISIGFECMRHGIENAVLENYIPVDSTSCLLRDEARRALDSSYSSVFELMKLLGFRYSDLKIEEDQP